MENCRIGCGMAACVHAVQSGIGLVHRAAVSACVEMACGACCETIAAGLHVPEQCLSQSDGSSLIANNIVQFSGCRARYRDCFKGCKLALNLLRWAESLVIILRFVLAAALAATAM